MSTLLIGILLVGLPSVSAENDGGSSTLTLSIKDAIMRALDRNPDELNYKERIREDEANKAYAISQLFPNISALGQALVQKDAVGTNTAQFGGDSYNKYIAQLHLTQPLYVGGALTGGLNYADKDIEIRKLDLTVIERDLIVQIVQTFYSVFTYQLSAEVLRESLDVQKQSLATAEKYYHIGRGQLIDVLQIKAQIALVYPQIETTDNQMKAAVSQLSTLMHEDQANSLKLIGSLNVIGTDAVKALLPQRKTLPEITRGETQISQFEDKKDVTLSSYWPNLSLQGTFGQTANKKSELFDEYSTAWTVGLYLTVPIFNGLASINERHALLSQAMQLDFTQKKLLDTLSYNQTQAERDLDTADIVLKGSKQASNFANDSLKEALRDYRLQTINYLQFLTSETSSLSAKLALIQAKGNYITALAKYCQATGIPIAPLVDLLESKKNVKEDI